MNKNLFYYYYYYYYDPSNPHLSEQEGFFVVDGVESVGRHHAGAELLADGVGGKPVHVHFHVRANLLVRQELTGDHLVTIDK